jgi:phenylacetaldehyde dehydrogenase
MGIALSPQIHPQVADFIDKPRKMLINGQWVNAASGKTFPTYNPATGEVLAQVAEGDREDIERAVKAARKAFDNGPVAATHRVRTRQADLEARRSDRAAHRGVRLAREPRQRQAARGRRPPTCRWPPTCSATWPAGPPRSKATRFRFSVPYTPGAKYLAYTLREPVGVVGQIIPWNFPLLMAAWKLGRRWPLGCTVVLKPAEQTPLSALRLGELIMEAGFPDGVVNIVTGYGETPARRSPRTRTSTRSRSPARPRSAS